MLSWLAPGLRVHERYELAEELGSGTYGTVWRAQEWVKGEHIGDVALKLCAVVDDAGKEQFLQEARALAQLAHPRIVAYRFSGVLETSESACSVCYLVMELAQASLEAVMRAEGPLGVDLVNRCMAHAAEGLAHMHARGAVHRDVKPANLLLFGENWRLGDMGLVRAVRANAEVPTGAQGSLAYMSPEQVASQAYPASDVYGLGVTAQEALTGILPYRASGLDDLKARITEQEPSIAPGLPSPWDELVPRMLSREPSERPTAAEVEAAVSNKRPARARSVGVNASLQTRKALEPSQELTSDLGKAAVQLPAGTTWPPGSMVSVTDGSVLVLIAAGPAIFGTDDGDGYDRERPRFRASLPSYYLGVTPVTVGQYLRFADQTGRHPPDALHQWDTNHPVVGVSWEDAVAYCEWSGLRLPSELEWEKGARGTEGWAYPWGNRWEPAKCACSCLRANAGTSPVGSYPDGRSPYGLLDMVGNVMEWCLDWYDPRAYCRYARGDLSLPGIGSSRVLRGGSWSDPAEVCRCTRRSYYDPQCATNRDGFRVARDA